MSQPSYEAFLIEDNPSDAELTMVALSRFQLASGVRHFEDGAQALDFVFGAEGSPASEAAVPKRVILLDLKMPKVDGFEVLRRLKSDERTRNVPVVVLSSSNQERDVELAYALGANSFVVKPLEFSTFMAALKSIAEYWLRTNLTTQVITSAK